MLPQQSPGQCAAAQPDRAHPLAERKPAAIGVGYGLCRRSALGADGGWGPESGAGAQSGPELTEAGDHHQAGDHGKTPQSGMGRAVSLPCPDSMSCDGSVYIPNTDNDRHTLPLEHGSDRRFSSAAGPPVTSESPRLCSSWKARGSVTTIPPMRWKHLYRRRVWRHLRMPIVHARSKGSGWDLL